MRNSSATSHEDLRVFHQGVLQGDGAAQFAATGLAEMTHLPTGVASGRSESISVAAGGELAGGPAETSPLILHVVTGSATVFWGDEPPRSAAAGPGDTVLVPAGVAFRACNASPSAELHVIRVRGS